ncbi:DUF2807 domain-containing protein [Sphingomonas sp. So64.6b]|uniref:GIN domain-containing protein n=1 Tax=Sphingomonas sp. So64.6b TaxID=2997354 RepID=UPI0016011052|nr:DUF2807 domain-containing protein [Sphingomonas sp. So64.6b]QNA85823.1 DUF2807 domain-containing protein [Sphingomonas sp. So64.6b]
MIRHSLAALLVLLSVGAAASADAAERNYSVGSFDRIRIDGPFDVRLDTGKAPGAHADADVRTLDQLVIRVEGTTLIVRIGNEGWGETPGAARKAPIVTLSTPMLRAANVNAGARLTVNGMNGQRIDLSINGSGVLVVSDIAADQLNATVIGTGNITLNGRAAKTRLLTNGSGSIDASALDVSDLVVRLDGTGETRAAARYTASVTTTGLGAVIVTGDPACTVRAIAGGPVTCGKLKPSR